MKSTFVTALMALSIAVPSVASAMNQNQDIHSERAKLIFMQLAEESKEDE